MNRSPKLLWPLVAALGLLLACEEDVGTPCRQDYHCYSNSCTAGTCDSSLTRELSDALWSDDEPAEEVACWELTLAACRMAYQCQLQNVCAPPACADPSNGEPPCPVFISPGTPPPCEYKTICAPR